MMKLKEKNNNFKLNKNRIRYKMKQNKEIL